MTERDWKQELETVGGAIGKEYKCRDGSKAICYGDVRYAFNKEAYPIVIVVNSDFLRVMKTGMYKEKDSSVYDLIGPWDEPKPKVQRAQAVIKYSHDERPFLDPHFYKDTNEILANYLNEIQIVDFPYRGIWREFDE